jgi:putative membrane protein
VRGVASADDRPASPGPAAGPDPAAEAAWAERPLDPRDYSRRTLLANERTFLAWWRTGLTSLAGALAAARVVPELADAHDRWPYTLLGVACAVAGIVAIAYGHRRRIEVEDGVRAGTFPPVSRAVTAVITGFGVLIGVGMLLLIVLET